MSPGLAGCQVKAALFKRIGRPGIAGPKACAGRTEPSNNASPHHGAEKLSIARADYLLAERVTIAANGNQGQECGYGTIRTRACLHLAIVAGPVSVRIRPRPLVRSSWADG